MSKRGDEVSYFRATELLLYNYPHMHDDTLAQVVKAYAARREYPVIQMRYFGRGLDGEQLPAGKYYTWSRSRTRWTRGTCCMMNARQGGGAVRS